MSRLQGSGQLKVVNLVSFLDGFVEANRRFYYPLLKSQMALQKLLGRGMPCGSAFCYKASRGFGNTYGRAERYSANAFLHGVNRVPLPSGQVLQRTSRRLLD